ncbi:MAG: hypothetical protein FWH02_07035 [Oscillospiraceae bacterium]|nr:hypothetical protein [Oscillospiraceae bacterium]
MQLIPQLINLPAFSLTGLSFLYVILPLFCFVHSLSPARAKAAVLLGLSLLFCVMAMPGALFFLILSTLFDYVMIRLMRYSDNNGSIQAKRLALAASVIKSAVLVIYLRGLEVPALPALGASVIAVSGTGAVFGFYRREYSCEVNFLTFCLYSLFFPRLYAGPLCAYDDFAQSLKTPKTGAAAMISGFGIYITGALKAGVLGPQLAGVYFRLYAFAPDDQTVLSHWLTLLLFALCLYYLLSGLCDMARGIGLMFGLELHGDFYYPYQSRNITDFFGRFSVTVTGALRRILDHDKIIARGAKYAIPLLLAEGVLLGLWLGTGIQFALWGLYLAVFAVMERYLYPKLLEGAPVFIGRVLTFCVVLSGFAVMSSENLEKAALSVKGMFAFLGGDAAIINDRLLYLLQSNWLALAAGIFFAVSVAGIAGRWLVKTLPRIGIAVHIAVSLAFLALYTTLSL